MLQRYANGQLPKNKAHVNLQNVQHAFPVVESSALFDKDDDFESDSSVSDLNDSDDELTSSISSLPEHWIACETTVQHLKSRVPCS